MYPLILHAGLHRTGSTYLRHHVFPLLPGVDRIGDLDDARAAPRPRTRMRTALISDEAAGGFPYPHTELFTSDRLAAHISEFGISRVFLIQREFHSWILSLYFQTLNERARWSLEEFVEHNRTALLSWKSAAHRMRERCDEMHVSFLFVRYEDLVTNPVVTIDRVTDFIGCGRVKAESRRSNASRYGTRAVLAYRFLNAVFGAPIFRSVFARHQRLARNLIQDGRIGAWLDRTSPRRLTPDDVTRLL